MVSEVVPLETIGGSDDFLIECVGFEDRSLGLTARLAQYTVDRSFLLRYLPIQGNLPSTNNEKIVLDRLRSLGDVQDYLVDSTNPMEPVRNVMAEMRHSGLEKPRITVDASVMSKYLLLLVLRGLADYGLMPGVRILYTAPLTYAVDLNLPLSLGTRRIGVVPTFEGFQRPRHGSLLVMLLGYEGDRAFTLWEKIEPKECFLIIPKPAFDKSWEGRTEALNEAIIKAVGNERVRYADSLNPVSVMNVIGSIFDQADPSREKNHVIAPLSTKPQTIGTFLYYWLSKSYPTIIYSSPLKHMDYSSGIGPTYALPLPSMIEGFGIL